VKTARLDGLDALRGIAALCVLAYHAVEELGSNAYLAVDFFFMLSGYVMARTYEARLASGLAPTRFIATRIGRLWPTLFLGSLLAVPWLLSQHPIAEVWPAIAANLLLIPFAVGGWMFLLNGPVWSIFFELIANALHAVLLWRLSPRVLAALLVPLIGLLALAASRFSFDVGSNLVGFGAAVPRVLVSYGIGILLWRKWRDAPSIKVSRAFTLLIMPVFFGVNALIAGDSWQADLMFVLLVCPLLIAGGLRIERIHPVLVWLGAISFPLYAVHVPAMRLVAWLGGDRLWGVALCIPLAWVLMHLAAAVHGFDYARLLSRRRTGLAKA
jgi:peptidoglycan/LPS O-acetylase OafA/YrhL